MKIEPGEKGVFMIQASEDELFIINNALNEICNDMSSHDCENRIGVPQAEAKELLSAVNKALRETNWY